MRRAERLWELFVRRLEEALERYRKGRLTADEAGELLSISGRHFRRLLVRYDEEGAEGLRDRRLGKTSPRRAAAEMSRMQILYQERYRDFTVKHFHELQKRRHYPLGYILTRLAQRGRPDAKQERRGTHREKPCRLLSGMLLFQDGSTHRRVAGLGHDLDLIVTLEDATGAIYSAILLDEEGTMSSSSAWLRGWPRRACSGPFTPTAARTIFHAQGSLHAQDRFFTPRPAARSTSKPRQSLPRRRPGSVGRWRSSASPASRPIRPRHAAAWSGYSAPCRAACRRSCGWPRSPRSRPPTAS